LQNKEKIAAKKYQSVENESEQLLQKGKLALKELELEKEKNHKLEKILSTKEMY